MRWVLVLAILLCACGHRKKPPKPPLFPELERVDPALVAELRPQVESWSGDWGHGTTTLKGIAPNGGAAAGWAILKILVQQFAGEVELTWRSSPDSDRFAEMAATRLGDLADVELKAALRRGVAAPELHVELRRKFVIALCREGNAEAVGLLVDRAIDRREHPDIRRAILERLHRIGAKPPERLRDALYLPFHRLDLVAAATLARMGDPEAPSLVLEGLETTDQDFEIRHFVAASIAITGKGEPYPERVVAHNGEDLEEVLRRTLQPHLDAMREWVDGEPRTGFERERRAYLASAQRRRELALASFEDVAAAGDDFDLASAILLVTGDTAREADLERLDRLARFVRRRLEGVTDPEARVLAINEALLHGRRVRQLGADETGKLSRLDYVLATDTGNCVGWTNLYLAVGERCGLPVRGVRAPGHIFVRYDDGSFRRNIEATDLGIARADESYREGEFGPSDLTRRQVVATTLNNASAAAAYFSRYDEAHDLVDRALALDPSHGMAYLNRAKHTFHSRLDADESVIADLEKALLVHPHRVECHLDVGDLFVAIGRTERALEVYRLAGEMESSARAKCGMAECLVLLGRAEEARAVAGADMWVVSRVRLAPDDARAAVETARCRDEAYVEVARVLLELDPPRSAEALALVDEAMEKTRKWREEWVTRGNVTLWVPANRTHRNLLALRARALAGLGRMDEARAELGKASTLEGSNRLLLEARAYVERR